MTSWIGADTSPDSVCLFDALQLVVRGFNVNEAVAGPAAVDGDGFATDAAIGASACPRTLRSYPIFV